MALVVFALGDFKYWYVSGFIYRMVDGGDVVIDQFVIFVVVVIGIGKIIYYCRIVRFYGRYVVVVFGSQFDAYYVGVICSGVVRYFGRDRDGIQFYGTRYFGFDNRVLSFGVVVGLFVVDGDLVWYW